jgi:hypothetical protein
MSSTYRPRVTDAISGAPVPEGIASAIIDQVGAAMEVAGRVGGEPGRALADAAAAGFTDGMGVAFVVGAAALLAGAVIVALFLPARSHDHEGSPARPATSVDLGTTAGSHGAARAGGGSPGDPAGETAAGAAGAPA